MYLHVLAVFYKSYSIYPLSFIFIFIKQIMKYIRQKFIAVYAAVDLSINILQ